MRKQTKRRLKRILALVLCCTLLFGNTPKVEAAEFALIGEAAYSELVTYYLSYLEGGLIAGGNRKGFDSVDDGWDYVDQYTESAFSEYSSASSNRKEAIRNSALSLEIVEDGVRKIVKLMPDCWEVYDYASGSLLGTVDPFQEGTHKLIRLDDNSNVSLLSYLLSLPVYQITAVKDLFKKVTGVTNQSKNLSEEVLPYVNSISSIDFGYKYFDNVDQWGNKVDYFNGSIFTAYGNLVISTFSLDFEGHITTANRLISKDPWACRPVSGSYENFFYGIVNGGSIQMFKVWANRNSTLSTFRYAQGVPCNLYSNDDLVRTDTYAMGSSEVVSTRLPCFSNYTDAYNAYINNDYSNVLNGKPLIIEDLTAASSISLGNAAEKEGDAVIDIGSSLGLINTLRNQIDTVPSSGDALADTEAYKDAVSTAVEEYVPAYRVIEGGASDPDPDPEGDAPSGWGILGKILAVLSALAAAIWGFFQEPIDSISHSLITMNNAIQFLAQNIWHFFEDPLANIQKAIEDLALVGASVWSFFEDPMGTIQELLESIRDSIRGIGNSLDGGGPDDTFDNDTNKLRFRTVLFGIFLLLKIVLALLDIFIHALSFIVRMFQVPAHPYFLPDDMVSGLTYLRTLEIPGLSISVYNFMMGLCTIIIFFCVIGTLRAYVNKIRD